MISFLFSHLPCLDSRTEDFWFISSFTQFICLSLCCHSVLILCFILSMFVTWVPVCSFSFSQPGVKFDWSDQWLIPDQIGLW